MTSTISTRTAVRPRPASRVFATAFAGGSYLIFLAVVGYAVAFLADVIVPRTVDAGGPHSAAGAAVLIDVLLLSLFGVQHSVMARPGFKRHWTRIVPAHLERSCFVLASSIVLALTFWQWRPLPAVIWDVRSAVARAVIWAGFGLGWALVIAMTFAIDHGELFGLQQVRRHRRAQLPKAPTFRLPLPYRLVRHPMMTGFFPAFLLTPTMTAGHLVFALVGSGYIVAAVRFDERDLRASLPEYDSYAVSTPRFFPRPIRRRGRL